MIKRFSTAAVFLFICFFINSLSFGQKFVSLEAGKVEHEFRTEYNYVIGTRDLFIDTSEGYEFGLAGGYRFRNQEKLSIALQGRLAFNNAKWTADFIDSYSGIDAGGPSHLEYKIPAVITICLCPELVIVDNLAIIGEIGLGLGYISQKKESGISTNYDYSKWTSCYTLAGGIKYRTGVQTNFYLLYRAGYFSNYTFESHFPDDMKWETISDEPVRSSFNIGILYSF